MAELKLKAATLIETIVAMVIIVVSVTGTMLIISQVGLSNKWQAKLEAASYLEELLDQTKKEHGYIDEMIHTTRFKVEKRVSRYENLSGVIRVQLVAYDQMGLKVAHINELVYVE